MVENQKWSASCSTGEGRGRVLELATRGGIGMATVSALDENGAPAGSVAVTGADGSYVLPIPSVRADASGTPMARKVSLRASARNYLTFPAGVRMSLPIYTSGAPRADSSKPNLLSR